MLTTATATLFGDILPSLRDVRRRLIMSMAAAGQHPVIVFAASRPHMVADITELADTLRAVEEAISIIERGLATRPIGPEQVHADAPAPPAAASGLAAPVPSPSTAPPVPGPASTSTAAGPSVMAAGVGPSAAGDTSAETGVSAQSFSDILAEFLEGANE